MTSKSFDVSREGKQLRLRMSAQDLIVSRLSRAFQVEERSLYLKEEFGSMTFWPNESGRFNTLQLEDNASLEVMGEDSSVPSPSGLGRSTVAQNNQSQVFSYSGGGNAGVFKTPPIFGGARKKNLALAKVIHAELNKTEKGAILFRDLNQTYISINQELANVTHVRSKAREAFNDRRLELVTSNGLAINDNDGTRALSFWKCGSRKIYAVVLLPDTDTRASHPKRAATKSFKSNLQYCNLSDDSEDEDFVPKKQRSAQLADLQSVKAEIGQVKCMVSEILEVNKALPVPVGIVKIIKDAFKCKICHETPMQPPVIATKCCNSLLGCESCVNTWYDGTDGLSKKCPHCNEPRGYASTFQFKGLDDFLTGITAMLRQEQNKSDES